MSDEPNPSGLCMCGCGQLAPISYQTNKKADSVKGRPRRYISGHNRGFHPTLADGFWAYCAPGVPSDCWEWQGCKDQGGYGQFSCLGNHHMAHRTSYELHYGPVPEGLWVLHKCDNRSCCNPAHLFLGTHTDNMRDMVRKGRGKNAFQSGDAHPSKRQRHECDSPATANRVLMMLQPDSVEATVLP